MRQLRHLRLLLLGPLALLIACQRAGPSSVTGESPVTNTPIAATTVAATERPTGLPAATPTSVPTVAHTAAQADCFFAPYGIGGEVPVYASPDFDSPRLGAVVVGERFPVLAKGGEWRHPASLAIRHYYQIQLDEQTVGWVQDMRGGLEGQCLSLLEMAPAVPVQSPTPRPPDSVAVIPDEPPADLEPLSALPGIIYEDEAGTWLVEQDGSHRHLSDQGGLKISPDGTRGLHIVDGDVWIRTLSSGEEINITSGSGRTHIYATWWPARPDTIVLSSRGLEDEGPSHGRLALVNDDGSNYRFIQSEATAVMGAPPAARPDGQTIAFDASLRGMVYGSDVAIQPFGPSSYSLPEGVHVVRMGSPSWSPDGERLAWMMAVTGGGYGQGQGWDIVLGVFDLSKREATLIHPYQPVGRGGWLSPATWSPDGAWLTFDVESVDENERGLWVAAADGSSEHRLSPLTGPPVIWSPPGDDSWANGRSLLLTLPLTIDKTEIWLVESGSWRQAPLALPATRVIDWRELPSYAGEFGIYLLEDDRPATELAEEELATVALQERPLIGVGDIVSYDPETHAMQLTEAAFRRVQDIFPLPVRVDGIPFVVRVGDERIYAGAFWTPLSSLSYDGVIIMQPLGEVNRTIGLALGYPSPQVFSGEDPRADPRIIEALEKAGKSQ